MNEMQGSAKDNFMDPREQTGRLFTVSPYCAPNPEEIPFSDNYEHLEALEQEALLILLSGSARSGNIAWPKEGTGCFRMFTRMGLTADDLTPAKLESVLDRMSMVNKMRENAAIRSGVKLFFPVFCRENDLDAFDQKILLLLLMYGTSKIFRETFSHCRFFEDVRGIKIRIILSLLCKDYRESLERRKHFGRYAPLVAREIIFFRTDSENRSTHLIDDLVTTNDRHIRYITGDNQLYNSTCSEISIERSSVSLDKVILPDSIKEDLVRQIDRYFKRRDNLLARRLDDFLEYGTALTLFFQGPSGTGKTMMARALAHHFNRQLITVNLARTRYRWELESVMIQAFREAALIQGFIFFDEADDIFKEGSDLARMLLIQIEKAKCVVIFATNKAGSLDPAMERRLSIKIHFGLPDPEQRMKIWRALLPDSIRLAPDIDLESLNNRYPFSGGLIKNTIFLALNLAEEDETGIPVINRQMLEQAADLQTIQMAGESQYCKICKPEKRIETLPLSDGQRNQLKNIADAFKYSKEHKTGLNVLISATNIETAVHAAHGLAAQCGLKVKVIKFGDMDNFDQTIRLDDPVSHNKISLMDYAFSRTTGEAHLLLIVDQNGVIDWRENVKHDDMGINLSARSVVRALLDRLGNYPGLCCVAMHECPDTIIPLEFHTHLRLEYPPEEMQIHKWRRHLKSGTATGDDLVKLVEQHPMHIAEIDSIIHRASIQSLVEGKAQQPSLETVKAVIERYRGKNMTPVLFGRK